MSWQEIKTEQAINFVATQVDPLLSKMCDIQAEMSEYYAKVSKPEQLAGLLINKAQKYKARAFFYEDKDYQLQMVFKVDSSGKLRVLTGAVGRYVDIKKAAEIIVKKLYTILEEYKTDYCYCLVPNNCKTVGTLFYAQFFIKELFTKAGFKDLKQTTIEDGKRIKLEALK